QPRETLFGRDGEGTSEAEAASGTRRRGGIARTGAGGARDRLSQSRLLAADVRGCDGIWKPALRAYLPASRQEPGKAGGRLSGREPAGGRRSAARVRRHLFAIFHLLFSREALRRQAASGTTGSGRHRTIDPHLQGRSGRRREPHPSFRREVMRQKTLWIAVLLILVPAILAQTPTSGLLTGTVKDPSGAVVPNAKLTLLSAAGEERMINAGEDGSYRFPLLPPGVYTLTVTAEGFQAYKATGISIRITESTELSPALTVAGAATSVDVTEEVPLVQTTSAATGRVISDAQIRELPLPTRNFQQLLTLSPGTV